VRNNRAHAFCARCDRRLDLPLDEVRGKLNWKLDCALRWALFRVDAEPFTKAYLEPQTGSFVVARALSQAFFGGNGATMPLPYGQIKMDRQISFALLECLPAQVLRAMMVERPSTDIHLTAEYVTTAASRFDVSPGTTYLEFVKQHLPVWQLAPETLSASQRNLAVHGAAFVRRFFSEHDAAPHQERQMSAQEQIESENTDVLRDLHALLAEAVRLRRICSLSYEEFHAPLKRIIDGFDQGRKRAVLHRLRLLVGQKQGPPATRLLFLLPQDALGILEYLLELRLASSHNSSSSSTGSEMTLLHPALLDWAA
jgi:lysyl-tRNA synthetase class I